MEQQRQGTSARLEDSPGVIHMGVSAERTVSQSRGQRKQGTAISSSVVRAASVQRRNAASEGALWVLREGAL